MTRLANPSAIALSSLSTEQRTSVENVRVPFELPKGVLEAEALAMSANRDRIDTAASVGFPRAKCPTRGMYDANYWGEYRKDSKALMLCWVLQQHDEHAIPREELGARRVLFAIAASEIGRQANVYEQKLLRAVVRDVFVNREAAERNRMLMREVL